MTDPKQLSDAEIAAIAERDKASDDIMLILPSGDLTRVQAAFADRVALLSHAAALSADVERLEGELLGTEMQRSDAVEQLAALREAAGPFVRAVATQVSDDFSDGSPISGTMAARVLKIGDLRALAATAAAKTGG